MKSLYTTDVINGNSTSNTFNEDDAKIGTIEKDGQIRKQLILQNNMLSLLFKQFEELENILYDVTRQQEEPIEDKNNDVNEQLVPLANKIKINNDRLKALSDRIYINIHSIEL